MVKCGTEIVILNILIWKYSSVLQFKIALYGKCRCRTVSIPCYVNLVTKAVTTLTFYSDPGATPDRSPLALCTPVYRGKMGGYQK